MKFLHGRLSEAKQLKRILLFISVAVIISSTLLTITQEAIARQKSLPNDQKQASQYLAIDYDYDSGVNEGVPWQATGNVYWDIVSGAYVYGGTSVTQASQSIWNVYVATDGREYCSGDLILWDTDWSLTNNLYNTSVVGQYSDAGWLLNSECSWVRWYPNVTVINDGFHYVCTDPYKPGEWGDTTPASEVWYEEP